MENSVIWHVVIGRGIALFYQEFILESLQRLGFEGVKLVSEQRLLVFRTTGITEKAVEQIEEVFRDIVYAANLKTSAGHWLRLGDSRSDERPFRNALLLPDAQALTPA